MSMKDLEAALSRRVVVEYQGQDVTLDVPPLPAAQEVFSEFIKAFDELPTQLNPDTGETETVLPQLDPAQARGLSVVAEKALRLTLVHDPDDPPSERLINTLLWEGEQKDVYPSSVAYKALWLCGCPVGSAGDADEGKEEKPVDLADDLNGPPDEQVPTSSPE